MTQFPAKYKEKIRKERLSIKILMNNLLIMTIIYENLARFPRPSTGFIVSVHFGLHGIVIIIGCSNV